MTAPERRRPLPALAFIGALTLLTALVWFRVIHRDGGSASASSTLCPTSTSTKTAAPVLPKVLPVARKVSVAVLNSTQRNGIATATKKALQQKGFHVTIAADDSPAYGGHGVIKGTGEIRYGPQSIAAATLLHYYLPAATMVATDSSSTVVTLSLGTQFKVLQTNKQVAASLQKAGRRTTAGALPSATASVTPSC